MVYSQRLLNDYWFTKTHFPQGESTKGILESASFQAAQRKSNVERMSLGMHTLNSRDIVLSITQATERRYLLARSRVAIGDLRDSLHGPTIIIT